MGRSKHDFANVDFISFHFQRESRLTVVHLVFDVLFIERLE